MQFKEELPASCPPPQAHNGGYASLVRFVRNMPPVQSDFESHSKLGKQRPPTVPPCKWASCSLFQTRDAALAKFKLPRLRQLFSGVAIINIPENSGQSVAKNGHVDFWMFSSFDPLNSVVDVEELPDG